MRRVDAVVCVVIPAYNARDTIRRAICSALREPEVSEVVVVNDASQDDTIFVAQNCDDKTGRLRIINLERNGGPSKARNVGIENSSAPYIAILDSDDFYLPGRFSHLLGTADCDMVADNIVFIGSDGVDGFDPSAVASHCVAPRDLSAASFVEGSISRPGRYKGELGFLKPLMSRAFLDQHALRYAEEMRLSEDYELYVRALIAGARFRTVSGCHYVAVERTGSLSVNHSVSDLSAVEAAIKRLRAVALADDVALRDALQRHHAQISRKRRHREVLDRKRQLGTLDALRETIRSPGQMIDLVSDVWADKLSSRRRRSAEISPEKLRFLL